MTTLTFMFDADTGITISDVISYKRRFGKYIIKSKRGESFVDASQVIMMNVTNDTKKVKQEKPQSEELFSYNDDVSYM